MIMEPQYEDIVEIPRDHYGRPMVIPPSGGKPVPYMRATTFAGTMEDTYNLGKWQQRKVAEGMAMRPDLIMQATGVGREPRKDRPEHKGWRRSMDEVADSAREAAAASSAATIGTALHALTERLDRGLEVGQVPADYVPHLRAYEQATAEFEAVHIEQFSVLDDLRIGGTPDRVIKVPGEAGVFIGDLKTGSIDYGLGKIGIQLALYAHCQTYDPSTGERGVIEGLRTDKALIIHLDALTGLCELVWVNLGPPWWAVELAGRVREWRKVAKTLGTPYGAPIESVPMLDPGPPPEAVTPPRGTAEALLDALSKAASTDELTALWQAAQASEIWEERHTVVAAHRKAALTSA